MGHPGHDLDRRSPPPVRNAGVGIAATVAGLGGPCSSIVRRSGVLTTDWDVPQFQKIRPRGSVAITRIDRAIRNFGNLMI